MLNEYLDLQLKVLNQLDELQAKIAAEDLDLKDVNYGHIGDLARISGILEELINPE